MSFLRQLNSVMVGIKAKLYQTSSSYIVTQRSGENKPKKDLNAHSSSKSAQWNYQH